MHRSQSRLTHSFAPRSLARAATVWLLFAQVATAWGSFRAYVTTPDGLAIVDGGRLHTLPLGYSRGVAVSPDGSRVYVGGGSAITAVDAASETIVGRIRQNGAPGPITLSANGAIGYAVTTIAGSPTPDTSMEETGVSVFDAVALQPMFAQAVDPLPIDLAATQAGLIVVSAGDVRRYSVGTADLTLEETVTLGCCFGSVTATLDDRVWAVVGSEFAAGFVAIVSGTAGNRAVEALEFRATPGKPVLTRDGQRLFLPLQVSTVCDFSTDTEDACADVDEVFTDIVAIDTGSYVSTRVASLTGAAQEVALTPDEREIFALQTYPGTVSRIEIASGGVVARIPIGPQAYSLAIGEHPRSVKGDGCTLMPDRDRSPGAPWLLGALGAVLMTCGRDRRKRAC